MNEQSFLREMQSALGGLSHEQREDILAEYRSHFFEGRERGKTDEDIAKSLGDPRAVARAYLADYHFTAWRSPAPGQSVGKSVSHLARALLVTFSLLFFNFFLMLIPVLMYSMFLAATWILVGAAIFVGFIFFVLALIGGGGNVVLTGPSAQLALMFYSLASMSLGGLLAMGLFVLSKLSFRGLIKYIKLNINLATA